MTVPYLDPDRWTIGNVYRRGHSAGEGDTIAWRHAIWRITHIRDHEHEGRPGKAITLHHVHGPKLWTVNKHGDAGVWLPAARTVFLDKIEGPYAVCSCHGDPWPCQEIQQSHYADRQAQMLDEKMAGHQTGICPACREPITPRQKTVTYPGDNAEIPGAPAPSFHTRGKCWSGASEYELQWIAVDPRRERILTWPKCSGILIVHADGTSECESGEAVVGRGESQPDCRGHLTHDHGTQKSCYVGDAWLAPESDMPGCPRGCDRAQHPGVGKLKRPVRRQNQQTLT